MAVDKGLSINIVSWRKSVETLPLVVTVSHHIFSFHIHPLSDEFSEGTVFLKFSIWRWQTELEEPVEEEQKIKWGEFALS